LKNLGFSKFKFSCVIFVLPVPQACHRNKNQLPKLAGFLFWPCFTTEGQGNAGFTLNFSKNNKNKCKNAQKCAINISTTNSEKKKKTWTLLPIRIYQCARPHSVEYGTGPNTWARASTQCVQPVQSRKKEKTVHFSNEKN
jgi:hypothetical protein